jgi:hypothetical protein
VTTTHTLTAAYTGPVLLTIVSPRVGITVTAEPDVEHARIELDLSGPLPENAADTFVLTEQGNKVSFELGAAAGAGGSAVIQSAVSTGDSAVIQVGRNFGMVADTVHGGIMMGQCGIQIGDGMHQVNTFNGVNRTPHSSMQVGDKLIEHIDGRTYINGKMVDGDEDDNVTPSDRLAPMPTVLHIRAIVPASSDLYAETANADVRSSGVRAVGIRTHIGQVSASGLSGDSWVSTATGDVIVAALTGARPIVKVNTATGDITAIGDVRLQPQTVTGSIRYHD